MTDTNDQPAAPSASDTRLPPTFETAIELARGVLEVEKALIATYAGLGIERDGLQTTYATGGKRVVCSGMWPRIEICFGLGILDVVQTICASLIGRGLLDAESLIEHMRRMESGIKSTGNAVRSLPAGLMAEALIEMHKDAEAYKLRLAASRDLAPSSNTRN